MFKILSSIHRYPSRIQIDITNRCNLKCMMCAHSYWEGSSADMSLEKFQNIIDQFPNLKCLIITGLGENLLNKDFLKMIRYAKSRNIYVMFSDNFFFLDKKIAAELIDIGTNVVIASIDGATKETYEKIRVGSDFEKVINNVKNFIQLKKDQKVNYPLINFFYVVNKYNIGEINKFIELVGSLTGGHKVKISLAKVLSSSKKEINDLRTDLSETIIKQADKKAKKLDIMLDRSQVLNNKMKMKKCKRWLTPFISVDGDIFYCCFNSYTKNPLGNIFEQSFKEIWESEKYKELRRMLLKGKHSSCCKNCHLFAI